jgi:hypothetical protein
MTFVALTEHDGDMIDFDPAGIDAWLMRMRRPKSGVGNRCGDDAAA